MFYEGPNERFTADRLGKPQLDNKPTPVLTNPKVRSSEVQGERVVWVYYKARAGLSHCLTLTASRHVASDPTPLHQDQGCVSAHGRLGWIRDCRERGFFCVGEVSREPQRRGVRQQSRMCSETTYY